MGKQEARGYGGRDRKDYRNGRSLKQQRRIKGPEIGKQVGGRRELNADKAGFPHIGTCHFSGDHGGDSDRRGEHADQAEIKQEKMRAHWGEAHIYQGGADYRDKHDIDRRGRHSHAENDADQ